MAYNPTHPSASYQPGLLAFPSPPSFPTPGGFVPPAAAYEIQPQRISHDHKAGGPVTFFWPPIVKKLKEILNSTVSDSSGQKLFTISTAKKDTIISDKNGRAFAKIIWHEWHNPGIEMEGIGMGKEVEIKKWMASLPTNKEHRRFMFNGLEYDWADGPADDNYLYPKDNWVHALGRLYLVKSTMQLDLYPEALQAGLLEICIVTAVCQAFPKAFGEMSEGEKAFLKGFETGLTLNG